MADKIKKFFDRKKSDLKFKKAGPGHKLSDSSSSSTVQNRGPIVQRSERGEQTEAEKAAAAAALARFGGGGSLSSGAVLNSSHASIQAQARKQLERERQAMLAAQARPPESSPSLERKDPVVKTLEAAPVLAASGVYFTCPLIGEEILSKEEWNVKIREFLTASLEEEQDTGLTACLIIRTLNPDQEKVDLCIETILKYLKNIADHPDEEKYRKIRVSNRIFQERVACLEGTLEFLRACGFRENEIEGEQYLVFSEDTKAMDLEVLMDALTSVTPIPLVVDRNTRVLRAAPGTQCAPTLPPAFYERAPSELKREQTEKAERLELELSLRTKAMRERDEERGREKRVYQYCIVRVKMPDSLILQGTFSVTEPFSEVLSFVRSCIRPTLADTFSLSLSGLRISGPEDESRTLDELKLTPACILNFQCEASSFSGSRPEEDMSAGDSFYLKPEVSILVSD